MMVRAILPHALEHPSDAGLEHAAADFHMVPEASRLLRGEIVNVHQYVVRYCYAHTSSYSQEHGLGLISSQNGPQVIIHHHSAP